MQLQRHIAYLVQEERAFICQLKTSDALGAGPGKGPALVTKEIALQQAGRHRRAVHLDHPPRIAPAEVVDRPGDQLFAGAGLAEDQYRAVAVGHHLHLLKHAEHRLAAPDDLPELALDVVKLLGQGEVFIHQPLLQTLDLLVGKGVVDGNRHPLGNLA